MTAPPDDAAVSARPTNPRAGDEADDGRRDPPEPTTLGEDDELSFPLQTWLTAKPGRPVLAAGMALAIVQLVVRGWSKFGGWFTSDDFSFMSRAFTMPLWSADYLLQGWHGHFMPGAFVVVKFVATTWPYAYTPVAILDLVLQAIVSVLVLRLLVNLFGARYEILIPFTFFVLTPMTLPASLWWAASLNQLWGQLAMVLILLAHLRYHRYGRVRDGLLGVLAMVFGLLFSEKVLLMAPVVAAFTLLRFTPGPPLARIRRALRENWQLWVAYGVLVAAYLVAYRLLVTPPLGREDPFTVAVQTVGTGLVDAVIPAMYGGPFVWFGLPGLGGFASPPMAVTIGLLITTALLVWYSVWRNARASFGWLVIIGYHVTNASILGVTRATYIGALIGAEYRYHTDTAMIIAVFGTMAFLPLTGTFARGMYQPLRPRGPGRQPITLSPGVVGAVCIALAVSCIMSTLSFDPLWRKNPMDTYVANIEKSVASVDHPITIIDYPVELVGHAESSTLFSAMEPTPRFLTWGASAEVVFAPDETGLLRQGAVDGFRNVPGPEPGCGWRLGATRTSLPLDLTTMPWLWTAQMSYLSTHDTEVTVTAGDVTTVLPLKAGAHTVFFLANGAVSRLDFGPVAIGSVCTDQIVVGGLKPVPNTSPASVDHAGG